MFVIYTRVSTAEQSEHGQSLSAQLEICRAHAGDQVKGVFVDSGVSGGKGLEQRENLFLAISCLEKGDVLLVARRDRLARDVVVVLAIEKAVAKRGATIVSCAGEGSGDAPSETLMRRMVDAFSEYERELIRHRTRVALHHKKKKGERTGHIPFGKQLCEDGIHLIDDAEEIAVIEAILRLRSQGIPFKSIAEILNQWGLENRGQPWRKSSVFSIHKRNLNREIAPLPIEVRTGNGVLVLENMMNEGIESVALREQSAYHGWRMESESSEVGKIRGGEEVVLREMEPYEDNRRMVLWATVKWADGQEKGPFIVPISMDMTDRGTEEDWCLRAEASY